MGKNMFLMGHDGELKKFGKIEMPTFKEINNIDWVIDGLNPDWWNLQPQYYEYLASASSKNAAILTSKTRYVFGKGWAYETLGLNQNDKLAVASFIRKITQSKVTKRIISDRNKHGGFCVEMIPDKSGKTWTPHYVAFKNVRVSKKEFDKDGKELPERYFFTKDWTKKAKAKENKDFTTFYTFTWGEEKPDKSKRYMVYYRDETYMDEAYPLPEYMGGVPYIDADCEIGNFVKHNVENGFTAGLLVNFFNGDPSPEQKSEIEKMWKGYSHGSENAGKAILSFNENKDSGVEVTQIPANGQDDRYVTLNNQIRDEIFTAHLVSPLVTGMKGDNGFANNADEKRTAIEAFQQDYVQPIQEIFNEFFTNLLHLNGLKGELYLQRIDPIQTKLSETTLLQIATLDEIREIAGLPESQQESNPVGDALKSQSPLVANKILESMTVAEIRSIIGLQTPESGVVSTTVTRAKQFEKDFNCEHFEKHSTEDSEFIHIDSQELYCTDIFDAKVKAENFRHEFASNIQNAILKLLQGDPSLTPKDLGKILKETPKNIKDVLKVMESDGLIEGTTPTAEGIAESEENEIFVVYKYITRTDAPELITESRPFCVEMLRLSKTRSWTYEQIQMISGKEGYDVFARRGGWYHNPETGKNTPYCRHIWSQFLVRRKNK